MPETTPTQPASSAPPRKRRRYFRLLLGLPILAVIWYFVGKSLIAGFRAVDWSELTIHWGWLAVTMLVLVAARLTNALNCRNTLGAMGHSVKYRQVVPIIWVASLGRYIPGKMAVVAGATFMLTRLGIRATAALAALFLATALMILLSLMACTPMMFTAAVREQFPLGRIIAPAMLAVGLVCLHPKIFTRLCNLALVRIKREPLPESLRLGPYLKAIGMTVFRTLLLGLSLWATARIFVPVPISGLAIALGAGAMASVAGFLAVFAPAGLGAHEAVYFLTMKPLMSLAELTLMVVLFRFLNLVADAITGGVGMLMLRHAGPDAASAFKDTPPAPQTV